MSEQCTHEAYGYLFLDGWAGRTKTLVGVVGETPKRFRIRSIGETRLAGRRYLQDGETALVPKHAIRIIPRDES